MAKDADRRRYDRRDFLRGGLATAALSLAGCSSSSDAGTPTRSRTETATPTRTPTATATATETDTEEPTDEPDALPPVGELNYVSPRDLDRYGRLVTNRKIVALRKVLAVPDAARVVTEGVSSTAYHRIYENRDFVEILAPREMTVEGDMDSGYTITYDDIEQVRGVVDRETDRLLKVGLNTWEDTHVVEYPHENTDFTAANLCLEDSRVADVLDGKDWYVSFSGRDVIAAFSSEYPIHSLATAGFNWNDTEGEAVALSAIVNTEAEEVVDVFVATEESPDPLTGIVSEVQGTAPADAVPRGSIPVPGEFDPQNTVRGHDWEVRWEDTFHDGYRIEASYKGKPVFGRETKIPWMLSDYEPFGMSAPGVPAGDVINYHFWDPLGVTGPGVVETHELDDGFRIRGTFHTGSADRWEWRLGQNYGPYRYIVDWSFFDDGTCVLTSRHPTTGYRVTNGYPRYTFHVGIEPAFDSATLSADRGGSWESVAEESVFDRSELSRLRIENSNGPERIVFDHPGERTYALQYDPELIEYDQSVDGLIEELLTDQQYLDPENYLRGNSIADERLYLRTLSSRKTGEGLHATTKPFVFGFRLQARNF